MRNLKWLRELFISVTERSVIMMCMKGSSRPYKAGTNLVKIQHCKVMVPFRAGKCFCLDPGSVSTILKIRRSFSFLCISAK